MATLWVHGGEIPACPFCGAPVEDQLRKPDGADRALWHCLVCERSRAPDLGWDDPLVAVSLDELRAHSRAMKARARARWDATSG